MILMEDVVQMIHTAYRSSKFVVPCDRWTVLACFTLVKADCVKVISIATGSRCLPAEKIESTGCLLFDCHAEVLSRRGAVRWFLEEVQRMQGGYDSDWLESSSHKKARLKLDVKVYLYVSTLPCRSSNLPTRHILTVP
jgi:tRNA-specific adenosine deaminase 1